MGKPEANFQKKFCDWLTDNEFKWIRVKANGNTNKGKPDVAVFWYAGWAWLEFKAHEDSPHRPGQDENVAWAQKNSYGSFVYPENEDEVKAALMVCRELRENYKCDL